MNKIAYVICILAAFYLGLQLLEFQMNEPYRNRNQNEAYINGEVSVSYYDFI